MLDCVNVSEKEAVTFAAKKSSIQSTYLYVVLNQNSRYPSVCLAKWQRDWGKDWAEPLNFKPVVYTWRSCRAEPSCAAWRGRPQPSETLPPAKRETPGDVWLLWVLPEFNNFPTRCDLFSLLYFCRQLYMFRLLTLIIRSSYNCNYSFWHWLLSSNSTTRADGSRPGWPVPEALVVELELNNGSRW